MLKKYFVLILILVSMINASETIIDNSGVVMVNPELKKNNVILLSVTGQGVSPETTISPAQAYALAKRAAIADAYRQLAEKLRGVKVEGRDYIKNMIVKRSEIRTCVSSIIRNTEIVETRFQDGMCEVEMELNIVGKKWYKTLAGL
ncbi:MAG: LPP20 family lipoprotein [Campylobacterota bacterium]|nr:LPP20 family lipoprotein [Campylobacterota bacterium]